MGKPRLSSAHSLRAGITAPRIERRIIEKNRRQLMKGLYSDLMSLIPGDNSKVEGLPLPDQIDEAVEYIKILKKKVEKMRQKKESLTLARKRSQNSYNCSTSRENNQATNYKRSSPLVEIQDMGPNFDLILANGLQDFSKFYDIIRLLHQHGVEIAGASFSGDGTSTIQALHDQVEKSKLGLEDSATLSRKLKELVCGTSSSEVVESQFNLWDYEIESDIWGSENLAGLPYCYEAFYT